MLVRGGMWSVLLLRLCGALQQPGVGKSLKRREALAVASASFLSASFLTPAFAAESFRQNGLVFVPVEGDVAAKPTLAIERMENSFGVDFAFYLSRVLLTFEDGSKKWWAARTKKAKTKEELDEAFESFVDSTKLSLARSWQNEPPEKLLEALMGRKEFESSIFATRHLIAAFALIKPQSQPSLENLVRLTENRTVSNATLIENISFSAEDLNATDDRVTVKVSFESPAFKGKMAASGSLTCIYENETALYRPVSFQIDEGGGGYSSSQKTVYGKVGDLQVAKAVLSEPVFSSSKPKSAVYAVTFDDEDNEGVVLDAAQKNARSLLLPLTATSLEKKGKTYRFPAYINSLEGETSLDRAFEPLELDAKPTASQFLKIALCGAACASVSHAALTPIEVAKTKLQVSKDWPEAKASLERAFSKFGPKSFFAGADAVILGYFFSGAAGFGLTAFFKTLLISGDQRFADTDVTTSGFADLDPALAVVLAALGASIFSTIIVAPFEAARVNAMAFDSSKEQPLKKIFFFSKKNDEVMPPTLLESWKASIEGSENPVNALFGSLDALLVKDIVFAVVKFGAFDQVSAFLYAAQPTLKESLSSSLAVSLLAGTLAGAGAAVASQPLDAAFTKLESEDKKDGGLFIALKDLYSEKGIIRGWYAGLLPRALFAGTLIALEFVIFEALKKQLHVSISDFTFTLDVLAGALAVLPAPSPLS